MSFYQVLPLFKQGSKSGTARKKCGLCNKNAKRREWFGEAPGSYLCPLHAEESLAVWASASAPQCNKCHGGLLPAPDGLVPLLQCDGCPRTVQVAAMEMAA